jgi:hypothetical protein
MKQIFLKLNAQDIISHLQIMFRKFGILDKTYCLLSPQMLTDESDRSDRAELNPLELDVLFEPVEPKSKNVLTKDFQSKSWICNYSNNV